MIENDIINYNAETRELYGSIFDKALKFVSFNCIHYIGDKHFYTGEGRAYIVLPLNFENALIYQGVLFPKKPYTTNYNYTPYIVTITYNKDSKMNFLHCSCQGWQSKDLKGEVEPEGIMCSHTLALKLYWKKKYFEKRLMEVI